MISKQLLKVAVLVEGFNDAEEANLISLEIFQLDG